MLAKSPVFNKSFFPQSLSLWMSQVLQPVVFLKEDIMIEEGEPATCMYFVRKGVAQLVLKKKKYGTVFDGSYVGEIPLIFDVGGGKHPCGVICHSNILEGYTLSAEDFEKTLQYFPDLLDIMKLVGKQRLEKLKLDGLIPTAKNDKVFKVMKAKEESAQQARLDRLQELFENQELNAGINRRLNRTATVVDDDRRQSAAAVSPED